MDKQNIRFILILAIIFLGFSLFSKYKESKNPIENLPAAASIEHSSYNNVKSQDIPEPIMQENNVVNDTTDKTHNSKLTINNPTVNVITDVLNVNINSNGDLIFVELKKYPKNNEDPNLGFNLLDQNKNRFYIAQSGLLSDLGPDSKINGRAKFLAKKSKYELSPQDNSISVDLIYQPVEQPNINFTKRFTFHRNSYLVDIEYIINNNSVTTYTGSMYGRLKRNQEQSNSSIFGGGLRTYTGAAINTPEEKYKKISFNDMKKPYRISFTGGWIAMLEHYFVSAWIPDPNNFSEYQTEKLNDNVFGVRFVNSSIQVAPGSTKTIGAKLYIGPKVANILKDVSPALDLTVDYGVLWWLCVPLFWLLKNIFNFVGNWGWSIIFTTLAVKLIFYKLSAYSYRSMGKLKNLQPRIEELKATYGNEKQKFSQAIMELYRKEKVNPLGGCLPILLQIPVFIALYYVLLESVELRQAHWCLWIKDLSAKDPFYILPVLMGISMFIQQKLNPPPADPVQAKVLMVMPILFSLLFLQFPSGLMLYWVVNNTLSIIQQFFIAKSIARSA